MKKQRIINGVITIISIAAMTFATMPSTVSASTGRFSGSTTTKDENNNICLNFDEVEVLLPSDWAGKCRMITATDSVSFYHLGSNDKFRQEYPDSNGGWLFSVNYTTGLGFMEDPSYMTIGESDGGYYYATFPTDVQAYIGDQATASEYFDLYADMEWIKNHMSLVYNGDSESAWTDSDTSDEYIFPQSSSVYLKAEDFDGMTAEQIQMAINEIYARHGRKFLTPEIQEYFNSLSWYVGTVEAADFDVNVMNPYEGANISLMLELMNHLNNQTD